VRCARQHGIGAGCKFARDPRAGEGSSSSWPSLHRTPSKHIVDGRPDRMMEAEAQTHAQERSGSACPPGMLHVSRARSAYKPLISFCTRRRRASAMLLLLLWWESRRRE
jgi:hypothetical protein